MGLIISACKGKVHVLDFRFGGSNGGFYELEPQIEDASDSKAIIMGVSLEFLEIVQPTTTLDDKRLLYLFGTAWNDLSVPGMLLLGDHTTKGSQLSKLLSWYNSNRVSKRKGPVSVSLGDAGLDAYVVGLSVGTANPNNNTQTFVIRLVTDDIKP
jgi:hypothetical protein